MGYFPLQAAKDSLWYDAPPAPRATAPMVTPGARSLPDLTWMRDPVLRRIAEEDLANLQACLLVGALKAAVLLAGSACEAMLLDVLERNVVIAKTHIKKGTDWPERVSLDDMIEIAKQEGLIKDLALSLAPALRAHRDLIHPNRARQQGSISESLVGAVANCAVVVAEALLDASRTGRIAAFETKT